MTDEQSNDDTADDSREKYGIAGGNEIVQKLRADAIDEGEADEGDGDE